MRRAGEVISPLRAHHAADRAQGRGLARAVGAEQGGDAALLDREVDAVQHRGCAVAGCELTQPRSSAPSCVRSQIGADHLGVRLHLGRRAVGDLPAEVERHDLVGERITRFMWCSTSRIVSAKRSRMSADQLAQLRPPPRGSARPPARRAAAASAGCQRARQLDALLRAERQIRHRRLGDAPQVQQLDQFVGALSRIAPPPRAAPAAGATRWRGSRRGVRQCAPTMMLSRTVMAAEQRQVLEGAADAERRRCGGAASASSGWPSKRIAPSSRR